MMTLSKTTGNEAKIDQLRTMLAAVLAEVLQRGFYGTAAVELRIADGTIQRIARRTERIER
jgi:hypothetical protein